MSEKVTRRELFSLAGKAATVTGIAGMGIVRKSAPELATGMALATALPSRDTVTAAWKDYREKIAFLNSRQADMPDDELEVHCLEIDKICDRIEALPAITADDVLVKIKYRFTTRNMSKWAQDWALFGGPVNEAEISYWDPHGKVLVDLINEIRVA